MFKFRNLIHDVVYDVAPDGIKQKIMSCEEVIKIMASEQELSPAKKAWFKAHKFICICCDNSHAQFKLIKTRSRELSEPKLSEEQKQKIADSKNDVLSQLINK